MKFTAVVVHDAGTIYEGEMRETYSSPGVRNVQQATALVQQTLDLFNATLRGGERPRKLSRIEDMALDPTPPHTWVKASLVTEKDKTGYFDRYTCARCSMTGRRYGLSEHVKAWPSWSSKKSILVNHCLPEKEDPVETLAVTPWFKTAEDGPPVRKGPYQTTADPDREGVAPLWRYFDGELRWGPQDASLQRAIERAHKEGCLLTSPLYYRGITEEAAMAVYGPDTITKETKLKDGDTWVGPNGLTYTYSGKTKKWVPPEVAVVTSAAGDKVPVENVTSRAEAERIAKTLLAEAPDIKIVPRDIKPKIGRVLLLDHEAVDKAFGKQQELPLKVARAQLLV